MKYIVYETINIVNGYTYIGIHKTNPEVFDGYLGEGIYINKPNTYKYSKTNFQIAVNTFGTNKFKRKTLAIYDTEKEALTMEGMLVNANYLAKPTVYNMLLGGNIPNIEVYRYDQSGNFNKEYSSIKEAAEELDTTTSDIYKAAVLGFLLKDYQFMLEKADNYADAKTYQTKIRKVFKYSYNGDFIQEYDSQIEACAKNKGSNVAKCIKTKLHCKNGFFWGLEKLPKYNVFKFPCKVVKYDKDGNLIAYYKSEKACRIANHLPKNIPLDQCNGDYQYLKWVLTTK